MMKREYTEQEYFEVWVLLPEDAREDLRFMMDESSVIDYRPHYALIQHRLVDDKSDGIWQVNRDGMNVYDAGTLDSD